MNDRDGRRAFLAVTLPALGMFASACGKKAGAAADPGPSASAAPSGPAPARPESENEKDDGQEVGAVEDLMREHGVIRRTLVVYREVSARLLAKPSSVPPDALARATKLMRTFGEDYHERALEEAHIFPALLKAGKLADTVQTLTLQHQRGREITQYVLATAQKGGIVQAAEPVARTLEAFARMYEEHAAIEDTIVFPAWKKLLTAQELDEIGDKLEDIEHKTFGKDGFGDAVETIAAIERTLGIDLAGMTAPPPPKA